MRRFIALACVSLWLVSPLSATLLLPAEFREIVSGSQIIVHGRVVEVRAAWSADRTRIDSLVTVQPSSFYRGSATDTITFHVPGGQVGRYKSVTVGAPEFRAGDEAVLFLKAQGPAVPHVFGLNQGVFRIRVDARTGRRLVVHPPPVGSTEAAQRVVRGARDRQPVALDVFASQVRTALQQGGAR